MTDLDKLSTDALRVLNALLESSDGNGHDFGLAVDAFEALDLSVQAFAAHVGHLAHVFDWKENLAADPGVQCSSVQFGLTAETIAAWPEVERLIAEVMTDETETPKPLTERRYRDELRHWASTARRREVFEKVCAGQELTSSDRRLMPDELRGRLQKLGRPRVRPPEQR